MYFYENFLYRCDDFIEEALNTSKELSDFHRYWLIKELLKLKLPKGNIDPLFFGSRPYGLATHASDLDIFMNIKDNEGDNFHDTFFFMNADGKVEYLNDIYRSLCSNPFWHVESYLPDITVPLIRAKFLSMNLNCDITVNDGIGVASMRVIKHLFQIQPEARRFFHFLRMFLSKLGIYFKTSILATLVIYFLQTENIMPSVKHIQEGLEKEYINGTEIQFDSYNSIFHYGVDEMFNYKDYAADFFEFYAKFDFARDFISVVDGNQSPRQYDYFESTKPMCVSSILRNDSNCAKTVKTGLLIKFQNECDRAYNILNDYDF